IFPLNLGTLGEETLLWRPPEQEVLKEIGRMFGSIGGDLDRLAQKLLHIDAGPGQKAMPSSNGSTRRINRNARQQSFNITREARKKIHAKLCDYVNKQTAKERAKLAKGLGLDLAGDSLRFEVHTVSVADRQGPDGRTIRQFVITLVQKRMESDVELWSGATILMDRSDHSLRYA